MTDLIKNKKGFIGPTFSLKNRITRTVWQFVWFLGASWTPPPFHRWRVLLLRIFGAKVSFKAYIYSDVKVWAPWNLVMEEYATLGRGVICYNIDTVKIGKKSVISQYSHLCTGTHDYSKSLFVLYSKPITIGDFVWICANTFVGPGVVIGDGAILSSGGVTQNNLDPWTIYRGNPAVMFKSRPPIRD